MLEQTPKNKVWDMGDWAPSICTKVVKVKVKVKMEAEVGMGAWMWEYSSVLPRFSVFYASNSFLSFEG